MPCSTNGSRSGFSGNGSTSYTNGGGGTSYINAAYLADPSNQIFQVGVNSGNGRVDITEATPVPEPSLVGGAVATLTFGWFKRRQQRAKTKA